MTARKSPAPAASGRGRALAAAVAAILIAALAWFALRPREDLVGKTLELEQAVLLGDSSGRQARRTVDQIIRNVDRMRSDDIKTLRNALDAEWLKARGQDIDAYFAATTDQRESILDRSIDRTLAYRELRFALNPRSSGPGMGGRRRRGRDQKPAEVSGDEARGKLVAIYTEALRKRAGERKIPLPEWQ